VMTAPSSTPHTNEAQPQVTTDCEPAQVVAGTVRLLLKWFALGASSSTTTAPSTGLASKGSIPARLLVPLVSLLLCVGWARSAAPASAHAFLHRRG
jgi:hypothetical protein